MELFQKIRFRAKRVEPAPVSQMEQRSARLIQRAWRRRRFFEKHGESILSRWLNIVQDAKEERRRERKEYIQGQKRSMEKMKILRKGGPLREDWRYMKQPPGGVQAADPQLPLTRQIIWTNHDVALFVAVSFTKGTPEPGPFGMPASKMKPFYDELCPPFRKIDVARMLGTLKRQGAIDDLQFLKHLHEEELERLLPAWVADDVRKQR